MPQTLVMLHGSRGAAQALRPLAEALKPYGRMEPFDLLGHGGRPIPEQFTVEAMAQDVLDQMDSRGIEKAYLFGYSFGGYIALYLARHAPARVMGVCTLATKIVFDARTVTHFTHLSRMERVCAPGSPQPPIMDRLHPGQDWSGIVTGLADLYRRLGRTPAVNEADLRAINVPSLVISASNDQLVPWTELLMLARLIPRSHAFTFAGRAHPLEVLPLPSLAAVIGTWLQHIEQ